MAWGHFLGSLFREHVGKIFVSFQEGDIFFFCFLCDFAGYRGFGNDYGDKFSFYQFVSINSVGIDVSGCCSSDIVYKILIWKDGWFFFIVSW